ncbi:MAG: SH3 domain-containing protein [Chloroflexi bacterium]|nr:SH3 domain-containing protein [Chloroflexota bacterium]
MIIIRLTRFLTLLILLNATLVHAYSIQVTYNTNLRAGPSLQSTIVETATAGATLNVIGSGDGWLRINRNGNEVWMSKSVSYTRVEGGESAAPRTEPSTQIDNCCFIDRQCATDEEWLSGYNAYQDNQCAAPSQQQQSTSSQSQQPGTSVDIDNCCFIGWQCDTDEEWVSGYNAYENNQCAAPSRQQQSTSSQSQQQQQSRQQRQQNGNQQQSQQQQQSPQEPDDEDPPETGPSGDLIFLPLTEEEWHEARCKVFGNTCDE